MNRLALLLLAVASLEAQTVRVRGLQKPVEILRDRWGVPHVYAQSQRDVFFAQGWITAKDRLWQIDLWRRQGTGKLAEVLGPQALARDKLARLVRYRGPMEAEWKAYGPDAQMIATAFVEGINAYIQGLNGRWPVEFAAAGYAPGLWEPVDVLARVAGLLMTHNLTREVQRSIDIRNHGAAKVDQILPSDPFQKTEVPKGLDLADITPDILRDYSLATATPTFDLLSLDRNGSNNWVIAGSRSATGKPLLANDPHRPILMPSLRKTVHLVAPGLNVIGAGEPALPGIALGHNELMGFGFTIVGIDQQDLYVERLNPANPLEYWHRNAWHRMEVVREQIAVKGGPARTVELKYTVHGPVIHEARGKAFALKWVGAEPGGAGYLGALRLMRARNWQEFRAGAEAYLVPSENLIYADRDGHIGWIASGRTPVRKGWNGMLPVPGEGDYEWQGHLPIAAHPQKYDPPEGFVATANHNILPPGYRHTLAFHWAEPFRFQRVLEMIQARPKLTVTEMAAMQNDIVSIPARRLIAVLKKMNVRWVGGFLNWDAVLRADSPDALIFEMWMAKLGPELFGDDFGARVTWTRILEFLEQKSPEPELKSTYEEAIAEIGRALGTDRTQWKWGRVHQVMFSHPLKHAAWNRGPYARPGDAHTVNATSGTAFRQTAGASFRMVLDPSNWDNSVMINTPGESGDPGSRHYDDLIQTWISGQHHPLPFSRTAVEKAAIERWKLSPQ